MARIALNGREYDGVEAMPPEVREQYQRILGALDEEDRRKVEAAFGHGSGLKLNVNVNVHRNIRINGKDYESVDAMPPDVRAIWQRAVAANPSLADHGSPAVAPPRIAGGTPVMPPAIDAEDEEKGTMWRAALWAAVIAALLVWLLLRR